MLKRAQCYTVSMGSFGFSVNRLPHHLAFLHLHHPAMDKMRTLKSADIPKHFLNHQREIWLPTTFRGNYIDTLFLLNWHFVLDINEREAE